MLSSIEKSYTLYSNEAIDRWFSSLLRFHPILIRAHFQVPRHFWAA